MAYFQLEHNVQVDISVWQHGFGWLPPPARFRPPAEPVAGRPVHLSLMRSRSERIDISGAAFRELLRDLPECRASSLGSSPPARDLCLAVAKCSLRWAQNHPGLASGHPPQSKTDRPLDPRRRQAIL